MAKKKVEIIEEEELISKSQIKKEMLDLQALGRKIVALPKTQRAKLPLDEDFWKIDGIAHLDKLRKGVRELVKYIDPVDQRYVTTDFADHILNDQIREGGFINEPGASYTPSPFQNNVYRLEQLIRENENHITIARIRKGEAITNEELQALDDMLFKGGIEKEAIEKELGKQFSLVRFIISLMGLSPEKVDVAFAKFINEYQLNAVQIQFLDTIKKFLTTNGQIDPSKLYEAPFKNYHSMGIDGVFTTQQADRIFEIVEDFNNSNSNFKKRKITSPYCNV